MANNILVNIVSRQTVPNLIPALEPKLKINRVILLVSHDMQDIAARLIRIYQSKDIPCAAWPLPAPAYDIRGMEALCREVLDKEGSGNHCIFNCTGGTKLMSCVAWRVFEQHGASIVYVDTAHGTIHVLAPQDNPSIDIQARLNLQTYLQAFGFQNIQSGSYRQKGDEAPSTNELSSLLAMHAPQLSGFLKKMNWSAHEVLNPWREDPWPRKVRIKGHFSQKKPVRLIMNKLEQQGKVWIRGQEVKFRNSQVAAFLAGGWLEDFCYTQTCRCHADEAAMHITGQWEGSGKGQVTNEFDCLMMSDNRLFIVECKTIGYKEKTSDVIYKLDSLKERTAGLFGVGVLVSAQNPPREVLSRAAINNQIVFGPEALGSLGQRFKKLIKSFS